MYLTLPWLIPQLLPGIAAGYGLQVRRLEIGRPGLTGIALTRLDAGTADVRIKVSNAQLTYRLADLLEGELETLTADQVLLTIEAATSEAADSTGAAPPAGGVPNAAAWFAAIPFQSVVIRQFTIEVPEVGFVGTGDVSYQQQQIDFAIYGIDPEPAQLLVARGSLNADGFISLELAESEPENRVFLATESVLKEARLTMAASIDLSGYPFQLVRSLLLLPAGEGEVHGEVHTAVALPIDADLLDRLEAQGNLVINWRAADGKLSLENLVTAGHLRTRTVQARFSQGSVKYDDENLVAQAVFEPGTTLTWSGEQVTLGAGMNLELKTDGVAASGISDVMTVDLSAAPAIRGAAMLDLVTEPASLAGRLTWQAEFKENDVVSGSGSWHSAGHELPFQFHHAIATGAGELTSAASLKISQPLAGSLLTGWKEDYDLTAGDLDYELKLGWHDDYSGRLGLTLRDVEARYGEDLIHGITASPELEITSTGISMAPAQFHIAGLDPGVPLTDLEARIGYRGDLISVQQASFRLLGGSAAFSDFEFATAGFDTAFTIDLAAIDLAALLALEGDDIQGEGRLDGQLPVQIRAGLPSIANGRLQSQPPGGTIRLAPDFASLTGQPGLDFAVKALTDYRYSSLAASVDYQEDGELKLGVSLEGRNPEVEKGRPIHYNLNVTENVLVLLESLRAQRTVTKGIERRALQQK